MNADDSMRPREAQFRSAGIGMNPRKLCDACLRPRAQLGGKVRSVGPVKLWHCAECSARKGAA